MAQKMSKKKSVRKSSKKSGSTKLLGKESQTESWLRRRIAILELECEDRGKKLDQQIEKSTGLEFDLAWLIRSHEGLCLDNVALEADRKKVADKSCENLTENIALRAQLGGQAVSLRAHKEQWRNSIRVSEILAFIICGSKAPREFFEFFVEGANLMGYSITKDLRGAVSRALAVAQSKRLSVETQLLEEGFERADFWDVLVERSSKVDLTTDEGLAEMVRLLKLAFERSKEDL